MTVDEIKRYFGSGYVFEQQTKMSHVNLLNWKRRGYVPLESQKKIERLTSGALKVKFEDLGIQ
ncbi:MAG: hypothetical protein ACRC1W_09670 [Shewanella sp.]